MEKVSRISLVNGGSQEIPRLQRQFQEHVDMQTGGKYQQRQRNNSLLLVGRHKDQIEWTLKEPGWTPQNLYPSKIPVKPHAISKTQV